jgi:predicted permease
MLFREITSRLRHMLGRQSFDASLEEELRLHIESRVEDLIAGGMDRREAVLQARREFGPAARAAEESRDAWRWRWLEDLLRDLRHAARTLRRDRGFAATAVLSLALGIGVNTTIFSLTAEFLFSQPSVRDPGTLVNAEIGGASHILLREYRLVRDAEVFDGLAGVNEIQEANWRTGDTSVRLFVSRVTDNFFEVTGVPVELGRPIRNGEQGVAVVAHGFWQSRLGGDPKVLGRTLLLDGQPHTIIGVLPAMHRTLTGFGYAPDIYLPVANEFTRVALYGRLPRGGTRQAALARLQSAAAELDRIYPAGKNKWTEGVSVNSLVGVERLNRGFLRSVSAFFGLLMAVVALLLLIACANVASLLLARGSTRVQEFAIRMSIGAGRGRLVRQMLAESLLLSLAGTVAGLAVNWVLTRGMNTAVLPMPLPVRLSISPDARLLTYAALVAVGSALVAGLLPAFKSTRSGTSTLLKRDEHQVSGRRANLRNGLVAGQLAVSVLVLIMAALSVRNLIASSRLDPGFDIRHTVWAQMRLVPGPYSDSKKLRAAATSILDRIRALPGVAAASVVAFVPLNDHFAGGGGLIFTDDEARGIRVQQSWNGVGPEYFKTMGIDILSGREFDSRDREGAPRVLILNEALSQRLFGYSNPVGRRIRLGSETGDVRTVIGVARNSKYSSIGEKDRPAIYEPYFQLASTRPALQFLVKADRSAEALLRPLNGELLDMDPTSSVEVKLMSRATDFALLPSRAGAALLGSIGSLGLLLASVGLYGVLVYSVGRRTREIGLRVALGARSGDVVRLVLTEGAWVLGIGLAAGTFLALFVTRPLAIFLVPGLQPSDPLTYGIVAAVLVTVGFVASLTPALRALRIDPMMALHYE